MIKPKSLSFLKGNFVIRRHARHNRMTTPLGTCLVGLSFASLIFNLFIFVGLINLILAYFLHITLACIFIYSLCISTMSMD